MGSLQECSNQEVGDEEDLVFNVIGGFDVPRFTYSDERKKYLEDEVAVRPKPKLYAGKERVCFHALRNILKKIHFREVIVGAQLLARFSR
jgi:hypothetical protein